MIEPTPLDNLISVSYIMYYLATGSLPWIGLTDKAMKESKKNSASFDYPSPLQCFSTLHSSNHIDPTQFIEQSIQTISQAVTKMGITFGVHFSFLFLLIEKCSFVQEEE